MKHGRNIDVQGKLRKFGRLLISGTLVISLISCGGLRGNDKTEVTVPEIIEKDGKTYFCLEKTDFTAIMQEALRCQDF